MDAADTNPLITPFAKPALFAQPALLSALYPPPLPSSSILRHSFQHLQPPIPFLPSNCIGITDVTD